MIPKIPRCTVDMLHQFDKVKMQDGGKKYQLGILFYFWDNLV
jgi:hypothetical protein